MQDVYDYIERNRWKTVELLARLCRQPSISAERLGLLEMSQVALTALEEKGFQVQSLPTKTGIPVVFGSIEAKGAGRTLLFYNHYDVQPVDPLGEWTTPPFEPSVRDGYLYARGATDNKGNIVSRLAAVEALLATRGHLPVGLKYVIEGEEEISSPGLPEFFADNRSLLMADACVWEDTMGRSDAPIVSLGNKGMCKIELHCRVADRDSHSAYAGVFPNAAWRLTWALASLKDQDERIIVPGFYDSVRPYTEADRRMIDELPSVDAESMRKSRGAFRLVGPAISSNIRARLSLEPTCNISGILTGYCGQGTKTVTPASAVARLDMRLVADQDPHAVAGLLRAHLDNQGFEDIELKILGTSLPSRTEFDTPLNRAIQAASEEVYGKSAIFEPHQAGSTPQWVVERHLGIPCAATGVGYVTSMTHAPDENIKIDHLIDGAKYIATIMQNFASEA